MVKILSSLYVIIVFFAIITLLYTVFVKDEENFTHIITGFLSATVFIMLGYVAYAGIEFQHVIETATVNGGVVTSITEVVELTTYQYYWLAGGLIVVGIIVTLYTVVQVINIDLELVRMLESNDIYDPNEKGNDIYSR